MKKKEPFKKENLVTALFDPRTGFELGTQFCRLYMDYNGFTNYPLNPGNEKEAALEELCILSFAAQELSIVLNIFPEDVYLIEKFLAYKNEAIDAQIEFGEKYYPLLKDDVLDEEWKWCDNWPWQIEGDDSDVDL